MASFKLFILLAGLIAGALGGGDSVKVDPQPTALPPQPTSSLSPNTTTSGTTSTTTTTAKPITTTTTEPPSPNTTSIPTSTTSKPTTSIPPTTSKSTTTPSPTPSPVDPKVANWTVNYTNSNRSCIILFVAAQFEIVEQKSNKTITINIPDNALGSGSCDDKPSQTLIVSWEKNSLEFDFEKTNTSKFDLKSVISTLNLSSETDPQVYKLFHEKPEFSTPLQNSYKCVREQTLNLTVENKNDTVAYLHLSHLQFQAFLNSTEHKFDSALDCEGSVTPDVVPIVVGCVLAALVVAVLAAYLFGRRRCQARGYLSMFEERRREADYIPMKNLSCFN